MDQGKTYHDLMLGSSRDIKVRERFQALVVRFTPYRGTILDFGAGTGIDAKAYAAGGFRILVYEPCAENRLFLAGHCHDEIEKGDIAFSDLATVRAADTIAANFAVLNLIADHTALFATFDRLLPPGGHVIVNMLNPFFAGDACYRWWWVNLRRLVNCGRYVVEGTDMPIYRFTPAAVAQAACPAFHRTAFYPAGLRLAASQYMFMVFRKPV